MTKRGLQGIAVGIFITTALITYLYFFQTKEVESHEEETEIPQFELSSEEMMNILAEKGFIVLEEDEYQSLLKAKEDEIVIEEPKQAMIEKTIMIKPGSTASTVAEILAENEIIEDAIPFIDYLRGEKLTTRLKVGEFQLNNELSFSEIAEIITQ